MHNIFCEIVGKIMPDRTRQGIFWVGGAHKFPVPRDGVSPAITMATIGPDVMNSTSES